MFGYYRIALCTPEIKVGNVSFNAERILEVAQKAAKQGAAIAVFPELVLTSVSCQSLFLQESFLEKVRQGILQVMKGLPEHLSVVLGTPLLMSSGHLVNGAVVLHKNAFEGATYKRNLMRADENMYFSAPSEGGELAWKFDGNCAVEKRPLFTNGKVSFRVELGDDLLQDNDMDAIMTLNPTAVPMQVGSLKYWGVMVNAKSSQGMSAVVRVGAGRGESTTDCVYGGETIVAENGTNIMRDTIYERGKDVALYDCDTQILTAQRRKSPMFRAAAARADSACRSIQVEFSELDCLKDQSIYRPMNRTPFVPQSPEECQYVCRDVYTIQSVGLASRLDCVKAKTLVLGISGGLDSTLALLVAVNVMRQLERPLTDVIAVTMPGFGTTDRTYQNAVGLCKTLGVTLKEIPIRDACIQHFKDIGHDIDVHDVTYENAQARERTQILFDLANQTGGILVGTGDLSEAALGWCTFNGDHMSMYNVNGSVPKTLMRNVIAWVAETDAVEAKEILHDIINTPVSPELLPADTQGNIAQKTEDIIGPYELHDFFLYHVVHNGMERDKILFLASFLFKDIPLEDLLRYWNVFQRRFISQQFKRNCSADGPQTGSVSLSPRGTAWRMPSDVQL